MRIDVFTIFPALVEVWLEASLIGKARRDAILDLRVHDLRSAATDPHRSVDDATFGGGAGMVLAPGPLFGAVEAVEPPRPLRSGRVILSVPGGWEWLIREAWTRVVMHVPRDYELVVRAGGGSAPPAPALRDVLRRAA